MADMKNFPAAVIACDAALAGAALNVGKYGVSHFLKGLGDQG